MTSLSFAVMSEKLPQIIVLRNFSIIDE